MSPCEASKNLSQAARSDTISPCLQLQYTVISFVAVHRIGRCRITSTLTVTDSHRASTLKVPNSFSFLASVPKISLTRSISSAASLLIRSPLPCNPACRSSFLLKPRGGFFLYGQRNVPIIEVSRCPARADTVSLELPGQARSKPGPAKSRDNFHFLFSDSEVALDYLHYLGK
jgi:hypothetical protein